MARLLAAKVSDNTTGGNATSGNFNGSGSFKFALVDATGATVYWTNSPDTTPPDGVPEIAELDLNPVIALPKM